MLTPEIDTLLLAEQVKVGQVLDQLTIAQQLCSAGWHRPLFVTGALVTVCCQECGADVPSRGR